MFSYYGSKRSIVHRYESPAPYYDKIIEPFAGSAQYALKYYWYDVTLIDLDPVVIGVWHYLQQASEKDILSLPNIGRENDLRKIEYLSQEEKHLIGFHLSTGNAYPINFPTVNGKYNRWNETRRQYLASELHKVRHWNITCADYRTAPNQHACWFIDPPYVLGGYKYRCSNRKINYESLAQWCAFRSGQVIVCEKNATWLPFHRLASYHGRFGQLRAEGIWYKNQKGIPIKERLSGYGEQNGAKYGKYISGGLFSLNSTEQ